MAVKIHNLKEIGVKDFRYITGLDIDTQYLPKGTYYLVVSETEFTPRLVGFYEFFIKAYGVARQHKERFEDAKLRFVSFSRTHCSVKLYKVVI
jgi:hypothetical protein